MARRIQYKASPERMIKAIDGSGGLKRVIAERLGCSYSTVDDALRKEGEEWDDVRLALKIERERIGDIAEETVAETMVQRLDLSVASTTARWYLDRKHRDRGYGKEEKITLEGGKNPLRIENQTLVPIGELELPLETKKEILKAMEKWERKKRELLAP